MSLPLITVNLEPGEELAGPADRLKHLRGIPSAGDDDGPRCSAMLKYLGCIRLFLLNIYIKMNHMAGWRDLMVLVNWDFSLHMCSVSCCLFLKKEIWFFFKNSFLGAFVWERQTWDIKGRKKGNFSVVGLNQSLFLIHFTARKRKCDALNTSSGENSSCKDASMQDWAAFRVMSQQMLFGEIRSYQHR